MTCDFVEEVGDMEGLNGWPTGNAELKIWARPPTAPSSAHLPLTTAMPSLPARSPSAQSTARHGTAHENLPLPLPASTPCTPRDAPCLAMVGEVRPRGSARRCMGFNPPSHAELSPCDLPEP